MHHMILLTKNGYLVNVHRGIGKKQPAKPDLYPSRKQHDRQNDVTAIVKIFFLTEWKGPRLKDVLGPLIYNFTGS